MKEIDIKRLPTGKYFLTIEIRDRYDKAIGSATKYFERKNPGVTAPSYTSAGKTLRSAAMYANADTVANILKDMKLIADSTELGTIDKAVASADMIVMQQTLYDFWIQRNQFDPDNALANFVRRANAANLQQCSPDQKLLMLRYGIPNTIVDRTDAANPFVVWHYYKIGNLTNIKFVFTPNGDALTLLHSNMPCERQNDDWRNTLFANGQPAQNDAEIFEGL